MANGHGENPRGQWASNFGFIMAAAGSAVGLGNLWKFPYLAGKNGGAAFVLVYMVIVVFVGFTIMLGEMVIGRHTQLSSFGAYKKLNRKWGFVGAMGVLAGFIILSYYSVIGGWVLNYITKYITGGIEGDTAQYFGSFVSGTGAPLFWHLLFMLVTIIIIYKGVSGGIEKASKIMMPALFVLLIVLAIRSVTLPGAGAGLEFYLKPDISKIKPATVLAALGQVFFSLSLGMGAIITYGSYLSKEESLPKDALIVPFLDTLVALLAGFVILPAVFAFGFEPGQGPGMMFVTLPSVFEAMPFGAFFGFLFFVLVFFAALTSSISLLEVTVAYAIDEFGWTRPKATLLLGVITFILGIPSALSMGLLGNFKISGLVFFDLMDYIASNLLLPLGGLFMCIFIGYVWGLDNAIREATNNGRIEFAFKNFWAFSIKWIAPLAIIAVFLNAIGILKL